MIEKMTTFADIETRHWCTEDGSPGCFGLLFRCGHSFACAADPAIASHHCSADWTPVLWSVFLTLAAVAVAIALVTR